jgi:hypothetical protein
VRVAVTLFEKAGLVDHEDCIIIRQILDDVVADDIAQSISIPIPAPQNRLLPPGTRIASCLRAQLNSHMQGDIGSAMFEHASKLSLEGIVSKHRDRAYRAERTPNWIKIKNPDSPAMLRAKEGSFRRGGECRTSKQMPFACIAIPGPAPHLKSARDTPTRPRGKPQRSSALRLRRSLQTEHCGVNRRLFPWLVTLHHIGRPGHRTCRY